MTGAAPLLKGAAPRPVTARTYGGTDVLVVHNGSPDAVTASDNETGTRTALAKLAELVEKDQLASRTTRPVFRRSPRFVSGECRRSVRPTWVRAGRRRHTAEREETGKDGVSRSGPQAESLNGGRPTRPGRRRATANGPPADAGPSSTRSRKPPQRSARKSV
jgi:hypothetical protein